MKQRTKPTPTLMEEHSRGGVRKTANKGSKAHRWQTWSWARRKMTRRGGWGQLGGCDAKQGGLGRPLWEGAIWARTWRAPRHLWGGLRTGTEKQTHLQSAWHPGRKDSRALTHKSQIAWTMWGARMLLGKMGSAGQGRTNVTNSCTVQFSSEGKSASTTSIR